MIKKLAVLNSLDDFAGGLLRFRISPTDHAAEHDDDYHHRPRSRARRRLPLRARPGRNFRVMGCVGEASLFKTQTLTYR